MPELLTHEFIVRALIAGCATATAAAVIGNFIVAARQSVISDMLAHAALAGVGLGIFLQASPSFFAGAAAVSTSILLWFLTRGGRRAPEAVSMLLLTGGLAVALLLAHSAKDNPVSFESFLFGSILTITQSEMVMFVVLCIFICLVMIVFWRKMLISVFDADFARVQIRYAVVYEILLLIVTSFLVAIALKVIGGLLVGALLVIPVLSAQNIAHSFRANVLWSIGVGVMGTIAGIAASFYIDIPTSSGIVLSLIGFFVITYIYSMLQDR